MRPMHPSLQISPFATWYTQKLKDNPRKLQQKKTHPRRVLFFCLKSKTFYLLFFCCFIIGYSICVDSIQILTLRNGYTRVVSGPWEPGFFSASTIAKIRVVFMIVCPRNAI